MRCGAGRLRVAKPLEAEHVAQKKVNANVTLKATAVPTEKNIVGVPEQTHASNAEEEEDTALFGDSAEQGQFPFLAAIFRSTEGPFLCVGSIISKNIVLTSTICLGKKNHPQYSQPGFNPDISVFGRTFDCEGNAL
uniref:Peptidase S1 domain-containing protein n=1 Tax=Timema bartmani TaxID=61472 RepID=A0A7R9I2A0_9NEOP|nr:unnamed protein product [Timema bartmani]